MLTASASAVAPTSALLSLIDAVRKYDDWCAMSAAERDEWDRDAQHPPDRSGLQQHLVNAGYSVDPLPSPPPRLPTWKEMRGHLLVGVQAKYWQAQEAVKPLLDSLARQYPNDGVFCCEQRAGSYSDAALKIASLPLCAEALFLEIPLPRVPHDEWERLKQGIRGEIEQATRAGDPVTPPAALSLPIIAAIRNALR